jgi:hypothetical protein
MQKEIPQPLAFFQNHYFRKAKNQHMQETNYLLHFYSDYPANSHSVNLPTPAGEKVASPAEIPGFNSIFAKIFLAKSDKFRWMITGELQFDLEVL